MHWCCTTSTPWPLMCWALGTTNVNFVGLCHGVQTTLDLIAGYVGVPKTEIDYLCAGINHMGWFLKLLHEGKDLYPILAENFEKPEYYVNEKVRGEVMRHFGYFMTESTGHLSEYVPWFRSSQRALELYCDEPAFGGDSGAYYNFCKYVADKYAEGDILAGELVELPPRSVEYGSYIIEAMETGRQLQVQRQRAQRGHDHQPAGRLLRRRAHVRRSARASTRTIVGDLPPQCAALNMTNINVQRLAVEAALTGDPEHIVHAVALDPLTSAVLTLDEVREMVGEMLEAESAVAAAVRGQEAEGHAHHRRPRGCKTSRRSHRPGSGHLRPLWRAGPIDVIQ